MCDRQNANSRDRCPCPPQRLKCDPTGLCPPPIIFGIQRTAAQVNDLCACALSGPPGVTGEKGEMGVTGERGIQGVTGEKGQKGDKGQKGEMGVTGIQGPPGGATGPKGEPGPTGPMGQKGMMGDQGPTGAMGVQGPTGAKGQKGDTGATGAKGQKGDMGETGNKGAMGDKGMPGGATGLKGEKGDQGVTGEKGMQGPTGPALKMCKTAQYNDDSYGKNAPTLGDIATLIEGQSGEVGPSFARKALVDQWGWSSLVSTNQTSIPAPSVPKLAVDCFENNIITNFEPDNSNEFLQIRKFSEEGQKLEWTAKTDSGAQFSILNHQLTVDQNGNVYVTAQLNRGQGNTLSFYNSDGTIATNATLTQKSFDGDVFAVKYNACGFVQWSILITNSNTSFQIIRPDISVDISNNMYITAVTSFQIPSESIIFFDTGSTGPNNKLTILNGFATLPDLTLESPKAIQLIAKFDENGHGVWSASVKGIAGYDGGFADMFLPFIKVDTCQNVYVAGSVQQRYTMFFNEDNTQNQQMTLTHDPGMTGSAADINETYLAKYNAHGQNLWSVRCGINLSDTGESINIYDLDIDNCNNIYVAGTSTREALFFEPEQGNNEVDYMTLIDTNAPNETFIFVAKFLPDGHGVWSFKIQPQPGSLLEFKIELDVDCCNVLNLNIDGFSTLDFFNADESTPNSLDTGTTGTYGLIAKYSSDGQGLMTLRSSERFYSIASDSFCQLVVLGDVGPTGTVDFFDSNETVSRPNLTLTTGDFSMFAARIGNDIKEAPFLGVVVDIDTLNKLMCIEYYGEQKTWLYPVDTFVSGREVYLDVQSGALTHVEYSQCLSQLNRLLGVACGTQKVVFEQSPPLRCPKKMCGCIGAPLQNYTERHGNDSLEITSSVNVGPTGALFIYALTTRTNNFVTFTGYVNVTPTSAALTAVEVELPFDPTTNFNGNEFSIVGTGTAYNAGFVLPVYVSGVSNNRISLAFIAADTNQYTLKFVSQYALV